MASPSDVVIIDGNSYSMDVEPAANSSLVLAEKETLLGSLDLKSLVQDLGRVGGFIRVAYNAVGAGGHQFQDLQIEVQRLGYDITKLCDKSAVTIAHFRASTKTVLDELKATYQFLLEGLEDMAVDTLATLSTLAEKMAVAASELQKEFENEEKKVVAVLEHTQQRKGAASAQLVKIEEDRRNYEGERKAQEERMKEYARLEEEAKAERIKYERKEDKELSSVGSFLNRFGNALTSMAGLGNLFDTDEVITGRANRWAQKSLQKLEIEKEQRRLRFEALQKMAGFASKLENLGVEEDSTKVAIEALHEASGAMKRLSLIMWQASLFWYRLQQHCLSLSDPTIQKRIEKFAKSDLERRQKFWKSTGFKQQMVHFYAKWVALFSVSGEYLEQIKHTQKDLYQYITENPTYQQSRDNLKALAATFLEDVRSAQDQLKEKEASAERERKAIMDANKSE